MSFSWSSGLIGAVAGLVILVGIGGVALDQGYAPINADAKPPQAEKFIAHLALHRALDRLAKAEVPPIKEDDESLTLGAHLYAQHCSVCHGTEDGRPTSIAQGLYQSPPQFATHGVDDDPISRTYWLIRHGIRLTGMPAFSKSLTEQQSWAIALFLKNLPKLDGFPHAKTAWNVMHAPGAIVKETDTPPDE